MAISGSLRALALLHRLGETPDSRPGDPVNPGDYSGTGVRAIAVERRREPPVPCLPPVDRERRFQPLAYSSADRDSNSKPTNRSFPMTHASCPGSMTYASPGP